MRALVLLGIVACGGAPERAGRLELVAAVPPPAADRGMAFDPDNKLVLMDGTSLRRLEGVRLDIVPNSQAYAFGSIGVDRDGVLLVASLNISTLARLEPAGATPVGPGFPTTAFSPVGTPSGSYYLRSFTGTSSLVLAPGAAGWTESTLDLSRSLRAPDGTRFAIVEGDVVILDPADTPVPVGDCSVFGGGNCSGLELSGLADDGRVFLGRPGDRRVGLLDAATGELEQIALPGALEVAAFGGGAQLGLLVAVDPDRGDEASAWILEPGRAAFSRIATLPPTFDGVPPTILVDRAGAPHLFYAGEMLRVVLE